MSTIRLDTSELERIAGSLRINTRDVLRAFAFEVEAEAKVLAPYDTGALKNSIYTNAEGGGSSPNKESGHVYEELPSPAGKVVAVVGSGIEYAAYQEFGTYKMRAQPYLGPAVEHLAGKLNSGQMWKELFR